MADYTIEVAVPNVGPQGPQGEVGSVGPTGPTGSTGPANSLAIGSVTTGAEGSAAAALITGTAPSQTLSLAIPVGATGVTGPANSLGIGTVSTGAPGSNAAATVTGTAPSQTLNLTIPRGDVGATGAIGPTGPQGVAGTGVVATDKYASDEAAVVGGIPFGGLYRRTTGAVHWIEEPDPDAATFIAASGATDHWNIQQFVKGIKDLGLWSNMVCWPLRSTQNAGTGTTAYSLGGLGTFNGTLVNGPVWAPDGITFGGITQRIDYSPQFSIDFTEGGYSVHAVWSGMGVAVSSGEGAFGLFASSDGVLENVITSGVLGGVSWIAQSRNYNGNRYHGGAAGNLSISGNVGYGWNADTLTLQTNGSDITTSLNASSTPSNGLRTMRTAGRNNTTASATSRVSYLIAFPPNVGMTTGLMTSVYNTAKATLGTGLGLP
jgi:hypothetical protein